MTSSIWQIHSYHVSKLFCLIFYFGFIKLKIEILRNVKILKILNLKKLKPFLWGIGIVLSVPHEAALSTVPGAGQLLNCRVDWVENQYWSGPCLTFYPSGYSPAELLDLWTEGLKSALSAPVLKSKDSYGPRSQSFIAHSYDLLFPLTLLQVRPVPVTGLEIHGWLDFYCRIFF